MRRQSNNSGHPVQSKPRPQGGRLSPETGHPWRTWRVNKSLIMNKKGKIESIHDYMEAAKEDKAGPYDDIVFVEPFTMLHFN